MILQLDDWIFDVDMVHTMQYSAREVEDHCTCAYCRNFYGDVDHACPELRPFLGQFGLNIEAPDALYPYDTYWDRMCYEGKYVVFGRILQFGKKRFDLQGCYVWPMLDDEFSVEQPHFVLSLEELEIMWILDEPMEDVLSPANEPGFLKKMWKRLLDKARTGTIKS